MTAIRENYAYWRARHYNATTALAYARDDLAAGKRRYGACSPAVEFNPKSKKGNYRWVENAADGMRLAGFADEILDRIRHRGWFTDDDGGEVYRGIVYQLPTNHGETRFAYGYADPCNEGAAYLCFDLDAHDKEQAARYADGVAERFAEEEREYQEAWRLGSDYARARDERAALRRNALALIPEIKNQSFPPAVCDALRDRLRALLDGMREAYETMEEKRAPSWFNAELRGAYDAGRES